jgi:hypothetical protein
LNSLLAKHKPKDQTKEEWTKQWNNAHPTLQPLADVLKEMLRRQISVQPGDYDTPNHYAKLVDELATRRTLQFVLDLLPDSVDKT